MTKQTKITIASVLFLLVAIADIYAVITQNKVIEMIFKPLLMTTLVMVYLLSVKKPNFWFVSGLFFSFWGDVFLLDKEAFFVFGLGSFLLAHVIYIKITTGFLQKDLTAKMITSAIPFVLLFGCLLYLIYDNLEEMLIPVIVYGVTIATFGASALLNYRQEKSMANSWLLLGAIIFIASDSLIALNNFYEAKHLFDIAIIVLYIISQYLICKAMIAKNE
ncbi:lysoplasmalogenase [uncultured Tenacibaculum sp.]|uniref:lysoplasmalogenase n=1 Tax=uncultured Tenacibaculum sp. TaxID=174713 RepID=UPI00262CC834|nr:lysoplasmalogenase [uncultured Tenacibaculum sp.]